MMYLLCTWKAPLHHFPPAIFIGDFVAILGHIFPNMLKGVWKDIRGNGIKSENVIILRRM